MLVFNGFAKYTICRFAIVKVSSPPSPTSLPSGTQPSECGLLPLLIFFFGRFPAIPSHSDHTHSPTPHDVPTTHTSPITVVFVLISPPNRQEQLI